MKDDKDKDKEKILDKMLNIILKDNFFERIKRAKPLTEEQIEKFKKDSDERFKKRLEEIKPVILNTEEEILQFLEKIEKEVQESRNEERIYKLYFKEPYKAYRDCLKVIGTKKGILENINIVCEVKGKDLNILEHFITEHIEKDEVLNKLKEIVIRCEYNKKDNTVRVKDISKDLYDYTKIFIPDAIRKDKRLKDNAKVKLIYGILYNLALNNKIKNTKPDEKHFLTYTDEELEDIILFYSKREIRNAIKILKDLKYIKIKNTKNFRYITPLIDHRLNKDNKKEYTVLSMYKIRDRQINDNDKVLYSDLVRLSIKKGYAFKTNEELNEDYGYSQSSRTISKSLARLRDKGYIRDTRDINKVDDNFKTKREIFIDKFKLYDIEKEDIKEHLYFLILGITKTKISDDKLEDLTEYVLNNPKYHNQVLEHIVKPEDYKEIDRQLKELDEKAFSKK